MAPVAPLGRDAAIAQVKEGPLPIALGSPHPVAMVVTQDGRFRIRQLVVDHDAAREASEATRRSRSPSWMPEHYYALGKPTGEIYADAETLEELVETMATMPWPDSW